MSIARAVIRFGLLLSVQMLFALIAVILHMLKNMFPSRRWEQMLDYKQLWSRCCCWCLNLHVRTEGFLPEQKPMLVVANHVGSPDIFVLAMLVRGFFVSKADVGNWPLVGGMLIRGGTLLIDREKKLLATELRHSICDRLYEGYPVILFPEGQASNGSVLLPFKNAGFQAAIDSKCPVLPVAITYHDNNTPSVACWSDRTFFSHLWALLKYPRLEATVKFLPEIIPVPDRRALALESHRAISSNL